MFIFKSYFVNSLLEFKCELKESHYYIKKNYEIKINFKDKK